MTKVVKRDLTLFFQPLSNDFFSFQMTFSQKLDSWFEDFGRTLPWRGIDDPYRIWLSEIILQQTRIEQGRDYYFRFVEAFPTVADLAAASEEQVLRLWQGLGYYSRARNLHAAAIYIMKECGGVFPSTYEGILKDFRSPRRVLPGVQDYYNRKGLFSDKGEKKKAFYVLKEWYEKK